MAILSSNKYNIIKGKKNTFADYPSIKLYKASKKKSWINHLLFGDFIRILDDTIVNDRVQVRCRGDIGWVKVSEIVKERVLEVNFIDIGQGDGCHIVTPDDQHIIVDAGKNDNMMRYLSWRFNLYNNNKVGFPFIGIVSHSDSDHYGGFNYIFKSKKIRFSKVYHNTIVERPNDSTALGTITNNRLESIVFDHDEMKKMLEDITNHKGSNSQYIKYMSKVLKTSPNVIFKGLSYTDIYLDTFDNKNSIDSKEFSFKILAPLHKEANGKTYLPYYSNIGKTKNGHSVILKLKYNKIKMLLGGDLNEEAGKDLVEFYDKISKQALKVDIAKACHHGSNHFYYDTLKRFNSLATIISSGDDESYNHPRPDTIGAIGKCGYSERPLVFSTEMARSNKEITNSSLATMIETKLSIEEIKEEISKLKKLIPRNKSLVKKKKEKLNKLQKTYNSSMTKYGMINVRTDGKRAIIAQKLERQANYSKWDIYMLEYSKNKKRFIRVE